MFLQIRIHESPTTDPKYEYNREKSDWQTTELLEVHAFGTFIFKC